MRNKVKFTGVIAALGLGVLLAAAIKSLIANPLVAVAVFIIAGYILSVLLAEVLSWLDGNV